jgi:hypothetical protein
MSSLQLILQQGPNTGDIFVVETAPKIIGRGATCDIVIADQSLSRRHVKISPASTGFCIEDLGSTNGVFVNGRRVTSPIELHPGDIIGLGNQITLLALFQTGLPGDNDATIYETAAHPMKLTDPVTLLDNAPAALNGATWLDDAPTALNGATVLDGAPTAGQMYGSQPIPARQTRLTPWLWVVGALIVVLLLITGALAYHRYDATPAVSPTAIAFTVTPATDTPSPPPEPTAPPGEPTVTPHLIRAPGLPALSALKQAPPPGISNVVDPFCNREIELPGEEPVFIAWQSPLAADADIDYSADWLAAVFYDISLDGQPLSAFNVHQPAHDPSLHWWANLGLLPPGKHYLRVQQYTNRPISNGLDLAPVDGQLDQFGPGLAGEGFCEIVIPPPELPVTPTATPTSTWTPEPEPTEPPPTVQPQPQPAAGPAPLGIFQDFETQSAWKLGDQAYGELTRSSKQVFSGKGSGQLSYNFPTSDNDYVVFRQSRPLAGRPTAISAMVFGDGAGHFLNLWIKDANGQSWSMSCGQVKHTGWQEMIAFLDPDQPWPSGHISGPDNGIIDYPISFEAIVLDDSSDSYSGRGVIYLDDLISQEDATPPTPQPATAPQSGDSHPVVIVATPTPALYSFGIGGQHRYEEPWGAPRNGDPCETWRNNSWDDRNANFRGFNVEMLLTNNSLIKVEDDWGEGMHFFTNDGQEVKACYYGYAGAGPPPGGATSLTFFSVVPKDSFVQMMQLDLNGQTLQICLDGRGGWSPC